MRADAKARSLPRSAVLVVVLTVLALIAPAWADVPLSDSDIQRFIDSMPEMRAIAEKHEPEFRKYRSEFARDPKTNSEAPFSNALAGVRSSPAYSDVDAAARRYGFEGAADWGRKADRISRAYIALEVERRRPEIEAGMAAMRMMIESNSRFSAEQKRSMLAQLQQGAALMQGWEAPEADKAMVTRHRPELETALRTTIPEFQPGFGMK